MMYSNILLPTDFPLCANAALHQAVTIAERFQGTVTMLHVVTIYESDSSNIKDRIAASSLSYDKIIATAEEMLHTKDGMIETPVLIEKVLLRGISPTSEILSYAAEHHPDLIVMGTHGRTGIRRLIMGSVAEKIIRLSESPVMTVRCGSDGKPQGYPNYRSILVPVDFSKASANALWTASEIARKYGSILTLLHVTEAPDFNGYLESDDLDNEELSNSRIEEAEITLANLLSEAPFDGIEVYTRVIFGRPGRKIVEFAHKEDIDLIIIPSHGKSGFEKLLMGSNVNKVVHRADVPVLVLKRKK